MNPIIEYKPYSERTPDTQYEDLLREILAKGKKKRAIHASLPENKESGHEYCLELPPRMLQYELSNGVPVIPLRDQSRAYQGGIAEIVAFINGARTLEELDKFGVPRVFWERWVTKEKCANFDLPEHDLGGGSYGAVLASLPTPDGKKFNQVEALIKQMQKAPHLRTHYITTWYPPLSMGDKEQGCPRKVVVAPCHGNSVQFNVFPDLKEMDMVHYQRSADVPVGLPLNLAEWVAFGMMVSYVTGIKLSTYTHVVANPQIYDIQIPQIEELLAREARKLPTLKLEPTREIKNVTDFRREDFGLEDYEPHPKMIVKAVI